MSDATKRARGTKTDKAKFDKIQYSHEKGSPTNCWKLDELRRQEQEWITHLTTFKHFFTFQFGVWAYTMLI